MTVTFDPDNWLVSLKRTLKDYVESAFDPDLTDVEMSFPDTDKITKETPLAKVLIHFEQDDISDPVMGFGTPGVDDYDLAEGTFILHEAQPHLVNFDVGVWVSAECGGDTIRTQMTQALKDLFTRPEGKKAMRATTGGLWPQSFSGGRNHLDRINDIPVWRAAEMTLIVHCFSRHTPAEPDLVATGGFDIDLDLTIDGDEPVVTP